VSTELPAAAQELVEEIRECSKCDAPMTICWTHQRYLDRVFPNRCSDPDCYACRRTS
jgi:hypothetical protein